MKVSFHFVFLLFYVSIASEATPYLVELLSILKETVCKDYTVAVHLCVLLPFIKEPAFMTSCSLPWVAKFSKIDLFMRKILF